MRNHEINSNNIADTIDNICTVPVSVLRGTEYRVLISYTDGQGYESTATSGSIALTDVDRDNDGLIEVDTAEQLNAIRYQLNGRGYRLDATTTTSISLGCPVDSGCEGYELKAHINLSSCSNWQPLGSYAKPFNAILEGNNYTISNLTINSTATDYVGLFAATTASTVIRNVGLLNVNIDAGNGNNVGGLVGHNQGTIENSYVVGKSITGASNVGALIGTQFGNTMNKVSNNYATIDTLQEGMAPVCKLIGNGIMIKGNQLLGGCADDEPLQCPI